MDSDSDSVISKRESCGDNHGFMVSAMFVPIRNPMKKSYISGFNSSKKMYKNPKRSTHAEIQALNNLRYQCSKYRVRKVRADLYIFRKTRDGNMASSAPCYPCTMQLAASKVVSIRKLYYYTENGEELKIGFSDYCNECSKNEHRHISRGRRTYNL